MHFTQIVAAIFALPALSMAAAVPRAPGFKPCSNFGTLTVGELHVNAQGLQLVDSLDVKIRADGSGEEGWKTIATVPKGKIVTVDAGKYPGVWNVQVCDSLPYLQGGGLCVAPDGYQKLWRFRATGDRWTFNALINDSLHRVLHASCNAYDEKMEDKPTVTVTATPVAPTTTTTSAKGNPSTTTTRANPTTTSRNPSPTTTTTRRN